MSNPATLSQTCPVLGVTDVTTSAAFFTEKLGFEAKMVSPEFFWAIVTRNGLDIHLSSNSKERTGQGMVYAYVDDADALYAEFKANGVEVPSEVTLQPYGMKDFNIVDADGNMLAFGQMVYEGP